MKKVSFQVCPNCGQHGHILIGDLELPEVHCQDHGCMQITALRGVSLLTAEEADQLQREIIRAALPTWAELMRTMITDVLSERADEGVATRLSRLR